MRSFFTDNKKFDNPFFIGTVEDNNDPSFNYRIKVRIQRLHPQSITTAQLPWAARVDTAFMGIGSERIDHKIPEVGTQVLCVVVGNDVNSLLYVGCLYKKVDNTPQDNKYLDTYGIYANNGQFIGIDKIQKLFALLFDGSINIDKIIDMTIKVKNSIKIECQNAEIKATKVTINAPSTTMTGNLEVKGKINADGQIMSKDEVSAKGGSVTLSQHTHIYQPGPGAPTSTQPGQG